MESLSKTTAAKPPIDRQPMCDKDLLCLLADHQGRTVADMATHFRVTHTAIRTRLHRLTVAQAVIRKRSDDAMGKRGRPWYLYYITSQGEVALAEAADDRNYAPKHP
jgi:predicted ArsR family transcriptional regulator